MKSEAIQLQKIINRENARRDAIDLVKVLLANPAVELIGSFVVIELLRRHNIIGWMQADALELGIGGIITVQQLAPALPALTAAGSNVVGAVSKVIPLLAAAA